MDAQPGFGDPKEQLARVLMQSIDREKKNKTWKPQPHQIPPPGDWLGWLLLAGRGAGKTEACAHYVSEHVKGPPCLDGTIPHWIGIIAPTLGDAATACFQGPSGIRHFDPEAEMKSVPGGLIVKWPNGSHAKMYGTREQEDVERLRAGGNTCVTGDTPVRTEHGLVQIKDVRVGDRVWTSQGLRRVMRVGAMGRKPVYELRTVGGSRIRLTADHQVLTQRGWCETAHLLPDDTIVRWNRGQPSSTMGERGISAKMATSPTHVRAQDSYIVMSGRSTTVRSRHTTSFTTSSKMISIRRIPRDSSASPRSNTPNIMNAGMTRSCVHEQVEALGMVGLLEPWRVRIVELEFPHEECEATFDAVSVTLPTTHQAEVLRVERSSSGCASCAAVSSSASIVSAPELVQDRVLHSLPLGREELVYDIQVEHDHEFFADDILVVNCLVWAEEMAAWRYINEAFEQMRFGLRSGHRPRWIGSTTPKPRELIKELHGGKYRNVILTHATMYDNPHLPDHIREALEESYGGTALGAQELYGRLVEQDENALWTRDKISDNRYRGDPADLDLKKIVVGVDPSGGMGEQGIVVDAYAQAWITEDKKQPKLVKHGYTLDDRTVRQKPHGWGKAAIQAAVDWEADAIVVETNFGGDMAVSTLTTAAEDMGIYVPIRTVTASRGKSPRAQPVSAMNVQGRWHNVGEFPELEDQLCTWTVDAKWSPDRLDAMVWPAWYMKIVSTTLRSVGSFGGAQMVRRQLTRRGS